LNQKIENYLQDSDVLSVAHAAASTFSSCLSKDEIKNCILNAIWKASNKFDKRQNTKFTSYLHNGVVFECLSQRKFNKSRSYQVLEVGIEDTRNPLKEIDMRDAIDSVCDDPSIVYDKYYNNMTIAEIAKDRGCCGETVRIRLKKNMEKLRLSLKNSV
jgi:DNA-directed RNA polymerase specialized sigma24 family protein